MRNVVVTYQVRPDAMDEHLRLIGAIFDELDAQAPDDVEYKVLRLADGVSFVHVSTADSSDGTNPLTRFAAFREFSETAGRARGHPAHAGLGRSGRQLPARPPAALTGTGAAPWTRSSCSASSSRWRWSRTP